jgi:phytanoyl-CoA hydroxylase
MRTELTDLEIANFRINGFVIIRDFLDDRELAQTRAWTMDLAGTPGAGTGLGALPNYRGSRTAFADERAAALWLSPGLGRMIGQAAGIRAVRYLNDAISFVEQGHGATPWHINMHEGWPIDSARAVSVTVFLDDARWNNKALNILPGTHLTTPAGMRTPSPSLRPGGTRFDQLFDDFPEYRSIEPVCCEAAAGGAILFNPLGVHGSAPNMTTRLRRNIGARYFADGEVYNGLDNLLSREFLADQTVGQPLRTDRLPVIWSADQ